jgi:protein-tyrosine kinase
MTKIYEALERAKRQGRVFDKTREEQPRSEVPAERELPARKLDALTVLPQVSGEDLDLEDEMVALYQTIDSLLPSVDHKVVQFMGSKPGEGTSTIAREFARAVALKLDKLVLLLDIYRHSPNLRLFFDAEPEHYDLNDILEKNIPIDKALVQIQNSKLYVSPLFQQTTLTPHMLDTPQTTGFWNSLRERFDFILIDSPPATLSADGFAMVRRADGVVLVVEAEKTKWPVATAVKDRIIQHGGNVLGIVFNRRKYYVPEWLYRRI